MSVYESYQQTNIDWLPSIPSTWKAKRIKNLFSLRDERSYKSLSEVNLISLYTSLGVRQHSDIEHTTGNKARNADGYKIVNVDDIIVNIMLCWMGAIGRSAYSGVTSPAYDIYKPHEGVNSSYYHYLFRTPIFSQQCFRNGHGIMMMRWRTYSPEFTSIVVPVPPREEQDQIVRFLDWKVSEINRLINIKRKEIERLEELKKAVVSRAVTYGDDGNEYPHIPLKRAFRILDNCRMPIAADMRSQNSEVLYDYYGASGVIDKIDGYTIDDDVLLIGEDGANLRLRNLPLIYQVHGKAWINNHAHILKPMIFMDYYYSFYMLETLDISVFITGAAQPKLTQEALRNLQIVAPPIEEQQKISAYLGIKCGEIDTVIENKHSQIKTLQEFKTRLISDVVTGKIDVRGIEIPEYEYTAEEADTDSEAEAEELDEEEE